MRRAASSLGWLSAAQWQPGLTTATDAAFYLFARGAQDYKP